MKMQEAGMSRDPADISVFLIVIKQASNKLIIEKKDERYHWRGGTVAI
jgi:hypothetical protein